MPKEERRLLNEGEKEELLRKHSNCYICDETLEGYTRDEIQFDHIYAYADGVPAKIFSNFAPVHASKDERKLGIVTLPRAAKHPSNIEKRLEIQEETANSSRIGGPLPLCSSIRLFSLSKLGPRLHLMEFNFHSTIKN